MPCTVDDPVFTAVQLRRPLHRLECGHVILMIIIEENNVIHPLEIKKSASPDRREIQKYSVIDKASLNRGNGGIICMCDEPIPIDADNCFIPSNLI